jgi:hypothetical protein
MRGSAPKAFGLIEAAARSGITEAAVGAYRRLAEMTSATD